MFFLYSFLFFIFSFFFEFNSAFVYASDDVEDDIQKEIFSPPLVPEDHFLINFGRMTSSNDFVTRSLKARPGLNTLCGVTNMHNREKFTYGGYEIDAETHFCTMQYERTISDTFRLSLAGTIIHSGAGIFDSSIMKFHDTFFMSNGPRKRENRDRYLAEGDLRSGGSFVIPKEDFGLRDPTLLVSRPLGSFYEGSKAHIETGLSLPLGLSEFSLSSPDFRVSTIVEAENSWMKYTFGVSGILHTDSKQYGIKYERFHYGGFFATNIPIDETFHILIALMGQSTMTRDIVRYSGNAVYLDTGVRVVLNRKHALDIVLRENLFHVKETADVSLFIRYNWGLLNSYL